MPKLIGSTGLQATPNDTQVSYDSKLPYAWEVQAWPYIGKNTGASDNYPLSLFNAGQDVITAQPVGVPSTVCSIGGYDGGVRQIDCSFGVNS